MSFKEKRVLVTGASGFIASRLTQRLLAEGADVYVQVQYNSMINNVRLTGCWDKVTPVEADLRNPDSLSQLRDIQPEIIFHLAAYNHVGDSFLHVNEAIESNGRGTVNLLEAYHDYSRFVYVSTSEVYGHQESVPFQENAHPFPLSPYSLGKYVGERYSLLKWKSMNRPIVVLRPFNAFGPYQSPRAVIAELTIKCLRGDDIATTEGHQTREFNFVENHVDGFLLAAQCDEAIGQVINLGCGEEIKIRDLVQMIHRMTGSKSDLQIGKLPTRPGEIMRMFADNRKAADLLGWSPRISFEEGLQITIDWYRRFLTDFASTTSPLALLGA